MKTEKRTVDDRLPKWLHSRFLSAVDYIWQGRNESMEESIRRIQNVDESGVFTDEEMSWVMMLITLPKLQKIISSSDEFKNFKAMKKASVH
jgi:isocitrate dehydrogenase kinase/phosphatase